MNLATWSIRDPIPSILLFFLLTVAGLWGFQDLKVQDLPDIDLPTVSVTLRQPGATTDAARDGSGAPRRGFDRDGRRTQAPAHEHRREGQVTITAEFVLERRLADALLDVKDAVDRVRSDLPQDLEEPHWRNDFWVDPTSGEVIISRQQLGPKMSTIEFTLLKPL